MLLKHYKPVVDYDSLPCTGQTLVYTDGNDTKSIGLTILLDSETDKINSLDEDADCQSDIVYSSIQISILTVFNFSFKQAILKMKVIVHPKKN